MDILTTRFGNLSVQPQDEILFQHGLIGLEECRRWVVLTDANNPALGWLQNLEHCQIALGIVSPRRFVPTFQLRIDRGDLKGLELAALGDAEVVVIASRHDSRITLNLRAPIVVNVEKRLGCQVIAKDELPVQYPLDLQNANLRRIA